MSPPIRILLILSLFSLSTPAIAQKTCWQIQVDGYGLVQMTYADLRDVRSGRSARGRRRSRGAGLRTYSVSVTVMALAEYGRTRRTESKADERYGLGVAGGLRLERPDLDWMKEMVDWLVEKQQFGLERHQCLLQSTAVALEVEAEAGSGDDVEIEVAQCEPSVLTQLSDALADAGQRVLSEVDDHRPRGVDLEAI